MVLLYNIFVKIDFNCLINTRPKYVFFFNYSDNRPEEVDELLESLSKSDYNEGFEVVIIEDGSSLKCEEVVKKYQSKLTISYYYKDNSGPGDSRNYGMKKAKGITLLYLIPIVLFQGIFRKWIA
jgi:hypothetical protein